MLPFETKKTSAIDHKERGSMRYHGHLRTERLSIVGACLMCSVTRGMGVSAERSSPRLREITHIMPRKEKERHAITRTGVTHFFLLCIHAYAAFNWPHDSAAGKHARARIRVKVDVDGVAFWCDTNSFRSRMFSRVTPFSFWL